MDKYVQEIYFLKFSDQYIKAHGQEAFMNDDLSNMWLIYVDYYAHISSFTINPNYVHNIQIKNEFMRYITKKRNNL